MNHFKSLVLFYLFQRKIYVYIGWTKTARRCSDENQSLDLLVQLGWKKKKHAIRCGGFNKNWNILLVSTILICLKLPNLKLKILSFANLAINQEDS